MTLELAHQCIDEAIQTLGLVLESAKEPLADLLANNSEGHHPKALCTKYRKEGKQISDGLKKQLGIRKNGFFSEKAYTEISDEGLKAPLDAHYITLLRAHFTYSRAKAILSFLESKHSIEAPVTLNYSGSFVGKCDTCDRLNETEVEDPSKSALPPEGCTQPACPMVLTMKVDFLSGIS